MIEEAVRRGIEDVLRPYLFRLCQPEPMVFTAAQVATVLQVSEDTVWRLVKRGVLPRVPHVDGKLLIPREAIRRLVDDADGGVEDDITRLNPRPSRPRRSIGDP
jgi:hypothetical protein